MTFEIGEPVGDAPQPGRYGRFKTVYEAVEQLSDGQAVPVTFDAQMDAQNFATNTSARKVMNMTRRGTVVYCSKKEKAVD